MNRFIFAIALVGCTGPQDVVGPFTGPTHRFVVDRFVQPTSTRQLSEIGDDLSGDGIPDNELGAVIVTLVGQNDVVTNTGDLVASGAIASTVEIQADDLTDDPTASVRYLGAPGDTAIPAGGAFVAGNFRSNRTATTEVPAESSIVVPVFIDADPSVLELDHGEVDLVADGRGGYDAAIRGLVKHDLAMHAAGLGLAQMVMSNPKDHVMAAMYFDKNRDGRVTPEEVEATEFVKTLLSPDVMLDGRPWLSFAMAVHLSPCDAGTCTTAPPVDACHDRVRDGDETGVDCGGGTCQACGDGGACVAGTDCTTLACDAGTCRDWSCHDGVRDGFEIGVDCGNGCGGCPHDGCTFPTDCASGSCVNSQCQ